MIFTSDNVTHASSQIAKYWKKSKYKKFVIEIKPAKKIRSLSQNKYYWGIVLKMIAEFTGYSDDTIHEMLKENFLIEYIPIKGKMHKTCQRTSELSTERFESYLVKCRMWAKDELDLNIPLPNEVDNETWMQMANRYDQLTY